jgi:hypothetical protein
MLLYGVHHILQGTLTLSNLQRLGCKLLQQQQQV